MLAAFLGAMQAACVGPTRTVVPKLPANLHTATVQELEAEYNGMASAVHSLRITANLTPSTGGTHSGEIKKYMDVDAYLLVQSPDKLRMTSYATLAGTLFDLASNGAAFEINIPEKNEYITGRNDVDPQAKGDALERLQPKAILDALPIHPIDANQDVLPVNDEVESLAGAGPEYGLEIVSVLPNHQDCPVRRIMFSRYTLLPSRQVIYDPSCTGVPVTIVTYDGYQDTQGVQVPWLITIDRPLDEWSLKLAAEKVTLNPTFDDSGSFQLTEPSGAKLIDLTQPKH